MSTNLTDPIFNDEDAAWVHFEAIRWPDGRVCPHCGVVGASELSKGKTTRRGLYNCRACEKPFTATMGTVYEKSHIPMHKWLLASHLMAASKKGISAHQLYRMLGFGSYRTAWCMAHRIREAMRPADNLPPMGGSRRLLQHLQARHEGRLSLKYYPPQLSPTRSTDRQTILGHDSSFRVDSSTRWSGPVMRA